MRMKEKGFTLVELLIVMAVVAILVAIIIPSFKGMQEEGYLSKAEQEVQTLQTAVESYYRHNGEYPPDLTASLLAAKPQIIYQSLADPWTTGTTIDGTSKKTYGYVTGNDTDFGLWNIIYSRSIGREDNTTWDAVANVISKNVTTWNADIAASNAPINF
ncbi:MAG: type II secretion system protein [Candidatus Margulisiibacteriota bacterium]